MRGEDFINPNSLCRNASDGRTHNQRTRVTELVRRNRNTHTPRREFGRGG
jgi:hypothetical protein